MTEDVDFEVDADDLPEKRVAKELGDPSIVVDDLHITYKVFASGKPAGTAIKANSSLLTRALGRTRGHVGAVTEVPAVRGVSFVAHSGESIGIVGTNGSGKSTLLRAIAGLIPPTKGRVFVNSEPALLGVNAALMRQLTGEKNIIIGGLALGLSLKEIKERQQEIVDFADLGDFVYMPMGAYSSGMASRLRFAISTFSTPDILMIDEALATGDASFRERSQARINDIRDRAGTIFFVSHSLASVRNMCTRAIWLDKGIIRMDGDVDEVADAYHAHIQASKGKIRAGADLAKK